MASPGYLKKHGHPTDPQQLVAERHLMIDFRDPETGRPFKWAFRKGRKGPKVETQSQLMLSGVATMHAVCLAGYGIAQVLELGVDATSLDWLTVGVPLSGLGRRNAFLHMPTIPHAPIPRTEDARVS